MVVLTKIGEIPEKPDRNTQYLRVTVCQRVGPCFYQVKISCLFFLRHFFYIVFNYFCILGF